MHRIRSPARWRTAACWPLLVLAGPAALTAADDPNQARAELLALRRAEMTLIRPYPMTAAELNGPADPPIPPSTPDKPPRRRAAAPAAPSSILAVGTDLRVGWVVGRFAGESDGYPEAGLRSRLGWDTGFGGSADSTVRSGLGLEFMAGLTIGRPTVPADGGDLTHATVASGMVEGYLHFLDFVVFSPDLVAFNANHAPGHYGSYPTSGYRLSWGPVARIEQGVDVGGDTATGEKSIIRRDQFGLRVALGPDATLDLGVAHDHQFTPELRWFGELTAPVLFIREIETRVLLVARVDVPRHPSEADPDTPPTDTFGKQPNTGVVRIGLHLQVGLAQAGEGLRHLFR